MDFTQKFQMNLIIMHLLNEQVIFVLYSILKTIIDITKVGELVCNLVYLYPFDNFKQRYTTYEKLKENNCQVE